MNVKELSNEIIVEVVEERAGAVENDQGFIEDTHNTYAGIGFELKETSGGKFQRTGRIFAWAGDNATGDYHQVSNLDLDDYLAGWEDDWVEMFEAEGIL